MVYRRRFIIINTKIRPYGKECLINTSLSLHRTRYNYFPRPRTSSVVLVYEIDFLKLIVFYLSYNFRINNWLILSPANQYEVF